MVVEKDNGGRIVSAQIDGRKVNLGQKVFSNGRMSIPNGTVGIIVEINEPYTDGRTSNILEVWFEGYREPYSMKTKDISWELR